MPAVRQRASSVLLAGPRPRLLRGPAARIAAIALGAALFASILVPALARHRYDEVSLALGATPPSLEHWFGTDAFGRDLLARVFFGGRVSFAVGALAVVVSFPIGVLWGTLAGYVGGGTGGLMMRVVDVVDTLPLFVVAVLALVFLGGEGKSPLLQLALVALVLGGLSWPNTARLVRTQVAALRERPFVEAARALGAGHRVIIFRHLLPNALGPALVYVTLAAYDVMLSEAFLSFLGLGTQEPLSSWGQLIAGGVETIDLHPWIPAIPGIFLALTLVCLSALGEALRDALDPRSRTR
jgi:oligopeptide transport system permease protein